MAILQSPLQGEEREKGANSLGSMVRLHIQLIACNVYYDQKEMPNKVKTYRQEGAVFSWTGSLYILFGLVIPI
ncbi:MULTISPECIES: hypothetical protein [Peribacillus]|uniref:hypothetical protein n=1 Tax=Peribacillus TaxID=2675229 RepID=UPI001F503D83|nr:hypothetical protein [Peribacillus frigoritolerans]MCK2018119.1 hypothetical protein [Peribacillus frigoritolerans]